MLIDAVRVRRLEVELMVTCRAYSRREARQYWILRCLMMEVYLLMLYLLGLRNLLLLFVVSFSIVRFLRNYIDLSCMRLLDNS
jgi:hypothetical protein